MCKRPSHQTSIEMIVRFGMEKRPHPTFYECVNFRRKKEHGSNVQREREREINKVMRN